MRSPWIYRGVLLILAFGAFLVLLIGIRNYPDVFDEGYSLYGAERILDGDVPYRDFWLVYAPAQFYVLAGIFKLFGLSIMAARIYDVLVRFTIVAFMYAVASKISSRTAGLVSALVGTLWLGTAGYYTYAIYPALALSLIALWFLLRRLEEPRWQWSFLCGLAVGGATLFRHDMGLYDAIAMAAVLAIASWVGARRDHGLSPGREDVREKRPADAHSSAGDAALRLRALWPALWPLVAGVSALVLPVLLTLSISVPASTLWFDLVVFPGSIINRFRSVPIPPLPSLRMSHAELGLSILFSVPIALYGCSIAYLLMRRRSWGVLALTLLGIFYLRQGLNRADEIHLLPTTLVVAVLAPVLVSHAAMSLRRWMSALLITAVVLVMGDVYVVRRAVYLAHWLAYPITPEQRYSLPRGQGIEKIADEQAAIGFVVEHTLPGEHIFVGDTRHDQLVVNDILFYFLADRPCGTRYHDLTPGVATTLSVQQAIVSDLQKNHVRMIVLCSRWDQMGPEPNESGKSSGVTFLDSYLRDHFNPIAQVGNFIIAQVE